MYVFDVCAKIWTCPHGHGAGRPSSSWHGTDITTDTGTDKAETQFLKLLTCTLSAMSVNPSECRDNYSATSNNMKLVHWPLMGGLLHLVQRGGDWAGCSSSRPLLAVPNVTAHPSAASVPITVLVYNGPLLCAFNVATKG